MAARGRPFPPGNRFGRGRPRGSRNKTTTVAQTLLLSHAEPVVRKVLLGALQGDTKLLQICMDRLLPVRRELPVKIGKFPIGNAAELSQASATITQKVAAGQITPTQGQALAELIASHRKVIETEQLERRLSALEGANESIRA